MEHPCENIIPHCITCRFNPAQEDLPYCCCSAEHPLTTCGDFTSPLSRVCSSHQSLRCLQQGYDSERPCDFLQWVRSVVFFAGAMAMASAHRVTFSVLALPLRAEYGLSLQQLGVLHSAVLAGYILGQVRLSCWECCLGQ